LSFMLTFTFRSCAPTFMSPTNNCGKDSINKHGVSWHFLLLLLLAEPLQHGSWVTVRQHGHGTKHYSFVLIKLLNRFSPLSDAPTEKSVESALVIGNSIVRNVKTEISATIVKYLPRARAPVIKANLKVLATAKCKYSMTVIHVDTNDV